MMNKRDDKKIYIYIIISAKPKYQSFGFFVLEISIRFSEKKVTRSLYELMCIEFIDRNTAGFVVLFKNIYSIHSISLLPDLNVTIILS